ncbi:spore coat protein [Terribacillus saccharophilus]|uniref:spore coat protein n=1 Tax=Terribacillus saccharophilus TaxID=361277 RepID=UPI0039828C55
MPENEKIQNPKTAVPTTQNMNDRDHVTDLLATEKYMTASYSTALNEMSNQSLYETVARIFKESQDAQRNLYNLMFQHGWYSLEQAQQQKVDQTFQQFSKMRQELPYT